MTATASEPWPKGHPLYVTPAPTDVPGAWFDEAAVEKVVRALGALRHTKGKWAGQPFELADWQIEWIIKPIFGWKVDGRRVVRTAWIEIPRKMGKSTLFSGLGLVLLCADGEQGAEVYAAAVDRDQARIIFGESKRMAERSPVLSKGLTIMRNVLEAPRSGSVYRVLSRVAEAAHGLNVHAALIDEVHVHKSRDLIDALETGTGAREQPLILFITTADEGDVGTIYAEKHDYCVNLANGVFQDPSFYGAIWAAEEDDDPFDEATWYKAMPGLGETVGVDWVRGEAERAQRMASYYATFARLILNRRVRVTKRYLPLPDWDASAGVVDAEALRGRECYGGLDLSSTTDLTAFDLVFPAADGSFDLLSWLFMPADNLAERIRRDQVPYDVWARQGFITLTPGNVVDYETVKATIIAQGERYDMREIAFDRWGATQMSQDLMGLGMTVVPMGQGFASMSPPTKELLKLVMEARLRHGGNPVLRWMATNMVVDIDAAENVKPNKPKSTKRIDGLVAAIMALDRAQRHERRRKSAYEDHGVVAV